MEDDIIVGQPFCNKCGEIMICLDGIEFKCNNPYCPDAKEYCENCRKEITDEMKNAQQVIYAGAEHTLSAPAKGDLFPFNDPMFSGPFCCQECFNEVVGINLAYKKGRKDTLREELEFLICISRDCENITPTNEVLSREIERIKGELNG